MDRVQACVSIVATVALASTAFAAERLAVNEPGFIEGIETVCGGVSRNDRNDTKWRAYSLRLEFVGNGGQYLGDETVTITGNEREISVDCQGPWVLMKLPAGSYDIFAETTIAIWISPARRSHLMTQDEKIKAETRLCALEVSVTHLWVMMYHLADGEPQEALQRRRKAVIESARNTTLSGIDPAMHAEACAKMEDAVRRLFDMQEESLAELRKRNARAF